MAEEIPYLAYCQKMIARGDSYRTILSYLRNKDASPEQIKAVMDKLREASDENISHDRKLERVKHKEEAALAKFEREREKAKENMTEEELKKQKRLEKEERDFLKTLERAETPKERKVVPGSEKKAWKIGVLVFLGSIVLFSFLAYSFGGSLYGALIIGYGLLTGIFIKSGTKSSSHKMGVIAAIVSALGSIYLIPLAGLAAFYSWSHWTGSYPEFWGFMVQGNFLEWMLMSMDIFSLVAIALTAYAAYKIVVGKRVKG